MIQDYKCSYLYSKFISHTDHLIWYFNLQKNPILLYNLVKEGRQLHGIKMWGPFTFVLVLVIIDVLSWFSIQNSCFLNFPKKQLQQSQMKTQQNTEEVEQWLFNNLATEN